MINLIESVDTSEMNPFDEKEFADSARSWCDAGELDFDKLNLDLLQEDVAFTVQHWVSSNCTYGELLWFWKEEFLAPDGDAMDEALWNNYDQ